MIFIKTLIIVFIILIADHTTAKDEVSLQLHWKHQFEFAGFYMAIEKGFYSENNLDVVIKEYEDGVDVSSDVSNGNANFGISYPTIIIDESRGSDLTILSAVLQKSPFVLVSLTSSEIRGPQDFKGKTLMLPSDSKPYYDQIILSILKANDVSINDLTLVKETNKLNDFINGKVDLKAVFTSNELFYLDQKNIDYKIWDVADYDFDFYQGIIFTSNHYALDNPDIVRRFNDASIKGWRYAFSNINETVDLILEKYNTQNKSREALIYEANVLKQLAYHQTDQLGSIDKAKLKNMFSAYALMGLTNERVNWDKFIFDDSLINQKDNKTLEFTDEEQNYLDSVSHLDMCINPNFIPYEFIDNSGVYQGVASDLYKELSRIINKPINIVKTNNWSESLDNIRQGRCDLIPMIAATPERLSYLNFTDPYLIEAIVIATTKEKFYINNSRDLSGKKIGIISNYAFVELLGTKNPNIEIIPVTDPSDGLRRVQDGELFGYLDMLPSIAYRIQQEGFLDIKIAGQIEFDIGLRVATRKDLKILDAIFDKALIEISNQKIKSMIGDWITINVEETYDYTIFLYYFLIFIIIISLILYRNRTLSSFNKKLNNSRRQLKLVLDNVPVIIGYVNRDLHYEMLNDHICKLYGLNPEDMIGHHIGDFTINEDEYKREVTKYEKPLQGEQVTFNEHFVLENGEDRWHSHTIVPYIENGQVEGMFGLVVDQTEMKKAQINLEDLNQKLNEKNKQLEKASITDKLTNLYNRHKLDNVLESEKSRSDRYKTTFGLILLDIDHFKSVNDTYGHDIGDSVLIELANVLIKNTRETDIVGRWGGEEFIIICLNTNLEQTTDIAEKCRNSIEKFSFTTVKNKTASFGVAIYDSDKPIKELVKEADNNLYKAKESGRNRVVSTNNS